MTYLSIFFNLFPILNTHTHSFILPSTPLPLIFPLNLPSHPRICNFFKSLNQKLSNSPLSMLIPSSFQQLMSSCLKDPLILHKCPPSAKQTSLGNSCKEENSVSSQLLIPFSQSLPLHSLWGPSVSQAAKHPLPRVMLTDLHSLPASRKHLRDTRSFLRFCLSHTLPALCLLDL